MSNFISHQDALELIGRDDVSFVDGSWYLPAQQRNGKDEYEKMRIPGAVYFDIDAIADQNTDLPHMLPLPQDFAREVSVLGISDQQLIIVYDGPGLFSAPRLWWTFKVMGAPDVRILEGGFDQWKENGLPVETGHANPPLARLFEVNFNADAVANQGLIEDNLQSKEAVVIDARAGARFRGETAEPRPGLRKGHIPGSVSLPFQDLIEDGKLKSPAELDAIFADFGIGKETKVITSCGSGVTAAILSLALEQSGRSNHSLFDGSWAQWGLPDGPAVATDE